MPPAAPSVARSREGGGIGQRQLVFPKSARRTLLRSIALCLGFCLAAAAATTPRASDTAFASAGDTTAMSAFNLLHLVTKSQPVAPRACGLPSGSCRDKKNCKVVFSQQELRKRLTPLQYHVTQEKGTESKENCEGCGATPGGWHFEGGIVKHRRFGCKKKCL